MRRSSMKYSHPLWDSILRILQYGKEKLEARGNGIMAFEIDKIYQSAINDFSMPLSQLAWALGFICKEPEVLPTIGQDTFNEDERKAIEFKDLQAVSTAAGRKSVKIAHERLAEEARLKPVTAAQKAVDEAKEIQAEKKRLADEAQAERDRPGKEFSEAEQETKRAAAELKKAEKEAGE